jgi:hypothetical protein
VAALIATRGTDGWLENIAHRMDFGLQNLTRVQHRRGKSLHLYSKPSGVFVVPRSTDSFFYSTNPEAVLYALENIIAHLLDTAL